MNVQLNERRRQEKEEEKGGEREGGKRGSRRERETRFLREGKKLINTREEELERRRICPREDERTRDYLRAE